MTTLSVYVAATGELTGTVLASPESSHFDVNCSVDHCLIEGAWNADLYRVDINAMPHVAVLIDPAGPSRYADRPPHAKWNKIIQQWEDARTPEQILAAVKAARIEAIKAEALTRMPAMFASLGVNTELFSVFRELWLSITPVARQPSASLTTAINVYQAASTALSQIRAASDANAVTAVVVNWP